MKISYDKAVDALNVHFRSGRVAKTVEVAPEVLVDLDKNGKMLNIEVIGAKAKLGSKNLGAVQIGKRSIALKSA